MPAASDRDGAEDIGKEPAVAGSDRDADRAGLSQEAQDAAFEALGLDYLGPAATLA